MRLYPAPKPPGAKRGRKPRAALGSSPLAPKRELTDEEKQADADLRAAHAFMHPPTTGADGEDLLHIPESMRK